MGELFGFLVFLALGGTGLASSIKIINQGNSALVERLGSYNKRLEPGVNVIVPFIDKIVYRETIREKVLDIPPQQCITRDNVSISADAVVYWRIVDMERAYYKVENLRMAMVNIVLTQIRAELGRLELDETFTARSQINEALLQDLDVSTEPWGVKVTRVELRDIIPSKAVLESMEMQMAAERRKRAAILTSEGEREAAVNSARGAAEAQVLDAEAQKKSAVLAAEAEQQSIILKAEADRQNSLLRAQGTAAAMQVVTNQLKADDRAAEALQFLVAQNYLDMGLAIGKSNSSKVMFMDPRAIPATMEGIRSILDNNPERSA
jgi:regulator of protease activity HflC (stomatin/prohibitin superfamily)